MGALLSELGKKLAERWLTLLVLPGALYLAVCVAGRVLGHAHPLDIPRLTNQITTWAGQPAVRTIGGQAVLLAAILAGSAAAGLLAQALGSLTERLCLAADWNAWPAPLRSLARKRVENRKERWNTAATTYQQHRESAARALARGHRLDPTERLAAYRAMIRIASEQPARPTWSGDRIHAVTVRLGRDHHLDLAVVWPYLWLTMPDTTRAQITTTREAVARATTLTGWALLYLPLTLVWWPAALIATVLAVASWHRTRAAIDAYASLLEAAARLHTTDLARHLGVDHPGPLDSQTGDALTRLLQSQSLPPASTG
jgi:hypothetical protein